MNLFFDDAFSRLVSDLFNYSIIITIFFILYKKKQLPLRDFYIYSIFCLSPFFLNEVMIDWRDFWDQKKYVLETWRIREEMIHLNGFYFGSTEQKFKVYLSSLIFALFPLVSISSINSVAFASKGIYCLTLIYLKKRKQLNEFFLLMFLFLPSILLFSSLSLRDILILSCMLISFSFLFEKKYFFGLIIFSVLAIIKPQNSIIVLSSLLLYWIFVFIFKKKIIYFFFFLIAISFVFMTFFGDLFFDKLDFFRKGLYEEEFGHYKNVFATSTYSKFESINTDMQSLIKLVTRSLTRFFFSPILFNSSFHLMARLDLIFVYLVFFINFIYLYKKDKNTVYFWLIMIFVSTSIYSLLTFNEITIVRYRFPLIVFFLFASNLSILNNKSK